MAEEFISYFSPELVDEVIATCQNLIRLSPHSPTAHRDLGHAFFKKGQYREAAAAFTDGVVLEPGDAGMHLALGRCYELLGEVALAEIAFQNALNLKPEWPDTHFWLGRIRFTQKRYDEALELMTTSLERNPRFRDALYQTALILEEQGKFKEAIGILKKVIAQPGLPGRSASPFPYDIEALFDDPLLIDETIRQLESYVKSHPGFADVHYKLGLAYRRKGLKDRAMNEFRRALQINPDFHLARHYYWHWDDDGEQTP